MSYITDWKLEDAVNKSNEETVIIFKHSSTCPVSGTAKGEMDKFIESEKTPVFMLIVQDSRELSNEIEEKLNTKHESPQCLVIKQGKVTANLHHFGVNVGNIKKEI